MWQIFVAIGLAVPCIVWVLRRCNWTWLVRVPMLVALIVVTGGGIFLFLDPVFLSNVQWYNRGIVRELLLFLSMVFGMSARYITQQIEARRSRLVEIRKSDPNAVAPKLDFDVWEFSYPLFVSVITFGGLLAQLGDAGLSTANTIMSFQTGFFWQTLLVRASQRHN